MQIINWGITYEKNDSKPGKIEYLTCRREAKRCAPIAVIFILFAGFIFAGAMFGRSKELHSDFYKSLFLSISVGLLGIGWFYYSVSGNSKRKHFKKMGQCFPGYIIEAESRGIPAGDGTFYLLISFEDNGKKIKYSEAYSGDPNVYLQSRNCNIYKYKNKYIEADLVPVDELTETHYLNIPISDFQGFSKDKYV